MVPFSERSRRLAGQPSLTLGVWGRRSFNAHARLRRRNTERSPGLGPRGVGDETGRGGRQASRDQGAAGRGADGASPGPGWRSCGRGPGRQGASTRACGPFRGSARGRRARLSERGAWTETNFAGRTGTPSRERP